MQYIHPRRWRIIVDESPVLFFSTHSPVFVFYSWRHRCRCHTRGVVLCLVPARYTMGYVCRGNRWDRCYKYTCTNSSACRSFVHAHMSLHTDVMSFRSASASMFLKSRFVIVLVCTAGFKCSKFEFNAMVIWQRVGMHNNGRDEVVVSLTHYEIKDMSSLMCWRMYVLG